MNVDKLNKWLMLASSIGILAGLFLVVIQLNQNELIARAQINSDGYISVYDHNHVKMGENPAVIIAKTYIDPERLTVEEHVVADAYLFSRWAYIRRLHFMIATIEIYGGDWRERILEALPPLFGNQYAKDWWARRSNAPGFGDSELIEFITSELPNIDDNLSLYLVTGEELGREDAE